VSLITTESKRLSERFRFLQFLHRYSDSEAASELITYEDTQDGLSLKYEADVKRLSPSLWGERLFAGEGMALQPCRKWRKTNPA
jgi:hypothetical protein